MKTWKENMDETKQHYIDWWNHKGIVLNMWEHFQVGVKPHGPYAGEEPVREAQSTGFGTGNIIPGAPVPRDNNQKWFDPEWRAEYLDWYVGHSCLKADMLPVANTQLGPGSMSAILGAQFEGGDDTIWIHPDPNYTDDFQFDPNHPNFLLHKELLRACKKRAQGHYYVGMPDLMEGIDVLAGMKGTDRVMMDIIEQPDVLERQMQRINDAYFKVFDELYDIIKEEDGEMAFCYFSAWAPGKMTKLQCDLSTMLSDDDYRRFVQPFIREQCQRIPYTIYHLDGVGAMHHLPALLEIKELKAIQWTPGVGQPQGGSPKWYDLYRKILAGGKSVLISWVTLAELRPLLEAIGTDGVHLEMDFHNEAEVEEAERIIAEVRAERLRPRGTALAMNRFASADVTAPLAIERPPLEQLMRERILIFDGAMGTTIHALHLTGTSGSNEYLSIERPEVIADIYRRFLAAGSDIITANTFNAQRCSLPQQFADQVREINVAACRLARQVADAFTLANPKKPRYVLGGAGPTRETISMDGAKLTFEQLAEIYQEQCEAQLEAGVDGLLNETIFDTQNCEAYLHGALAAMQKTGIRVPLMLSFTVRTAEGYNMVGQNIIDFCKQLHPDYHVLSVGINCNPDIPMVTDLTRRLANETPYFISVFPNAGIPDADGIFPTQPDLFQRQMWPMFDEHLINIVGGCCGTHDGHMHALAELVETAPGCYVSPHIPGRVSSANTTQATTDATATPSANNTLTPLQQAVLGGKVADATRVVNDLLSDGKAGGDIINEMIEAMSVLGTRFEEGKAFVPQLLMAGKTMKAAMALIKEYQTAHGGNGQMESLGKVVVGTVKGDLHDIGKNLVISMLEGSGFEVVDLGIDVAAEKFVEAVKREKADILSMSALLTTTMTYMPEVIQALRDAGIRDQVKVMIGGAPVTQEFCDRIGADAYTDNANQAVACAKELMKKKN
ncbi:MAG: homocysteine S-methyltransferase family protein [Bacteroidales bacterium]|nr:homocysteine S-methyltransferase family protein [Bacteroidales bacterium]